MRFNWNQIAKRAKLPAAGGAMLGLLLGAYWLGGLPPAETATQTSAQVQNEPREDARGKTSDDSPANEPARVSVPSSASGASSSGVGGETWAAGDTGRLGAGFRRAVSSQFGTGSMGQADRAMTGLGFQCSFTSGRMNCEKSMQAGNCMLKWSVQMEAHGGSVGSAGGEGFSRNCT